MTTERLILRSRRMLQETSNYITATIITRDVECNVMQAWEMYNSGFNDYMRFKMQGDAGFGNVH